MNEMHFQVDSRIATLLSQEYSSTEKAVKELVDNAWDADASVVRVVLPTPMTQEPITIGDDGNGMTEEELRRHYLSIARDRRAAKGERTVGKKRLIKGRKGIGKFAGLMAASVMSLETKARGRCSRIQLTLDELSEAEDIERLPINHNVSDCPEAEHGTSIVLSELHQGLAYPDPDKLRQVLLQEYGRQDDFTIFVNGKELGIDDVRGTYRNEPGSLPLAGNVRLRFSISDGKAGLRQPGITLRVDGKAVGNPGFFGLDRTDDFPKKLLNKLFGEIDADGLAPHVTAGWSGVLENSELMQEVETYVRDRLRTAFEEEYGREMQLAQARLRKAVKERLADLPEYKREFAERAIKRVLDRFYGEPKSKLEPIVFVLLEALERSDYRALMEHIADASRGEIGTIADALADFGLADMAHLVQQAEARSIFLDQLERLAVDPLTLEASMHVAIARSLWIFGPEYSLFSSNQTLRRQVEDYLGKKYAGKKASRRPDLLLNENLNGEYLLIEFKRPGHCLGHADYQQLTGYRNELKAVTGKPIRVLLLGGKRGNDLPSSEYIEKDTSIMLFKDVIATARRQVAWLLRKEN
ncbi:ATP-binding protein [Luteibacter sp. 9133]|uniref:ATP-binding protein n=1 Tax=Luteibacter sp. 9133 TaxID=1500891 RepID=UPI0005BA8189|nr:ATP-binding protein [Luteibacter sp. 9133]